MHKTTRKKIEVLDTGHLQVATTTVLVDDDGTETALHVHRTAYEPRPESEWAAFEFDKVDEDIKAHARVAWTPAVVSRHRARQGRG